MASYSDQLWFWFLVGWERLGKAYAKPAYSVTLWGSNPDETSNDDCWTGDEFLTRDEALACYRAVVMFPEDGLAEHMGRGGWEFVMVDGPDVHDVTANPDQPSCRKRRREIAREDHEWHRERAMQAGMVFGCDGYNDEMGW
jgi:hypothetical protein